jgi:phosphate/sulfate permease
MTTITFICATLLTATYFVRIVLEWRILTLTSVFLSTPVLFIFLIAASADKTPFTHGANDNASGTSLVMGLVERLTKSPLQNTLVWGVNTGCEEVGAYGAAAWISNHRDELDGAILLTLDNLGGRVEGPCYLTKEKLIFPFSSDPTLVKMATELAVNHPSLKAHKYEMKAAYTEGAIGIRAGLRCLTFVNYRFDGVIPDWHQPSDTIENIDWDVMQRTEEFVWLLIQAIDRHERIN